MRERNCAIINKKTIIVFIIYSKDAEFFFLTYSSYAVNWRHTILANKRILADHCILTSRSNTIQYIIPETKFIVIFAQHKYIHKLHAHTCMLIYVIQFVCKKKGEVQRDAPAAPIEKIERRLCNARFMMPKKMIW